MHRGRSIQVERTDGAFYFTYKDGTEFVVGSRGDFIGAVTPPGAMFADTCTYLVGPVLGFALRLRGLVCLHASAVLIDGRAVAFCGPGGAGKSTTCAAFAQRRHSVLTEDVLALDDHTDRFCVRPGYPRVNLWEESAAALYGSADALPAITPTWEKRYLPLADEAGWFCPTPTPLAAVFILGGRVDQPRPEICRLQPVEALVALASNTYTPYLLDSEMRSREFDVLGRLARHVPVHRLLPSAHIANIGTLCDAVLSSCDFIQ